MSFNEVGLVKTEGVAVITLDAPERRNALTADMARELIEVFDEIEADGAIGAALLLGRDGQFCAGADRESLERIGEDPSEPERYDDLSVIYESFQRLGGLGVPTVAAVRGSVVGAGLNMMLAADVRIVARDARILSGFLRIGLHPGGGHFVLVARLASAEAAAALAIFGDEIDGQRARELGLAWECVQDDEVEGRAYELAAQTARDPALSRMAVATLRREVGPPMISWDVAVDAERSAQMWSMARKSQPSSIAETRTE